MAGDIAEFTFEEEYKKTLKSFHTHSTEIEVGVKWLKKELPGIIGNIKGKISDGPFRVLAVGTSDGTAYDDEVLGILSKFNMKVHYTVVEPRADAIDVFKDRVKSKFANIQFEWFPTTFESYQDKEWTKYQKKFHLIHFIHSLYHLASSFQSLGERLRPCYKGMLTGGGALITIVVNESQDNLFFPLLSSEDYCLASSDVVGKLARNEGWKHEYYNMNYRVDLTECFDENSKVGGYLLDFFTRIINFRETSDRVQLNMVMKHLDKQCELMEDGRKMATRCNKDITVIWKK